MGGRKRVFTAIVVLVWSAAAPLLAQAPPPAENAGPVPATIDAQVRPGSEILESYQVYRAALERDDFAAALEAAKSAYDLSMRRDGLGGRTGVLAYNYAVLILDRGDAKTALPVAQTVMAALDAGAEGVSRPAALAALGHAMLVNGDSAGVAHLDRALMAANPTQAADQEFAYRASVALGAWHNNNVDWLRATVAWRNAQRFAAGASIDPHLAKGAAAIREIHAWAALNRLPEAFRLSDNAAINLVVQVRESVGPEPNEVERLYATALAWRAGVRSAMAWRRWPVPASRFPANLPEPVLDGVRRCRIKITTPANLSSFFPSRSQGVAAGVTVRVALDAQGQMQDARVIALVGPVESRFGDKALQVMRMTRFERHPEETDPACRLKTDSLLIPFAFGGLG
jgi:hypothetical protein